MWKVIVLFAPFLANVWLMFKKHYKIGISAHSRKQKKGKKNDHFEGLLSGPSKGYYLGQVCCNIKMANLAQIITLQIFAHTFFVKKKCWKPYFNSVFSANSVLTNLAQIITLQMANLAQIITLQSLSLSLSLSLSPPPLYALILAVCKLNCGRRCYHRLLQLVGTERWPRSCLVYVLLIVAPDQDCLPLQTRLLTF